MTDANQLARELRLRARRRSELRRGDSRSKRQSNTGEGVFKCCSNQPRCSDKPWWRGGDGGCFIEDLGRGGREGADVAGQKQKLFQFWGDALERQNHFATYHVPLSH